MLFVLDVVYGVKLVTALFKTRNAARKYIFIVVDNQIHT